MKKKLVIAFDILVILILAFLMIFGRNIQYTSTNIKTTPTFSKNENLGFDLIASPEETRVKAGETVIVTLSLADINVGENGLNNVIGYLGYNEALFDEVKIYAGGPEELAKGEGTTKWEIEINRIKNHSLYGKFCIFTMQEGVKENQDIATLIFKLKDDLKPQTTKVTFTNLESSDGNVSIKEDDREVTIIIYEDAPVIPEEPVQPEPEEPKQPVQTGDVKTFWIIALLVVTIIVNVIAFAKTKKNKIFGSILVCLIGFIGMQYFSYAADVNKQDIINQMSYQETWLNSGNYLVTEENISRIPPNTNVETIFNKFNKSIEIKNGDEKVTTGKVSTGMEVNVENPSKVDADGNRSYKISVFGDINGDSFSNHVDLTSIIRNVVNKQKWNLAGIKFISADITVDNNISREDVLTSVDYIVYGELEIPSFKPVEKPSIEIIFGEKDETETYYTSEVKVKITENEVNGLRTQYKISKDNEEITSYTEISRENKNENGKFETEITLKDEGIYKISAYTNGQLGNRSEIPYILVNIGKDKQEYGTLTIHHYNYNSVNSEEKEKIVDDEIIEIEYGAQYEITSLMSNTNVIKVNGEVVLADRSYLEDAQYECKAVECDTENTTLTKEGVVTGTAFRGMEDISYYYSVNTYKITGEVIGGNGKLVYEDDENVNEILEIVEYGKDATKTIVAKPDVGYKVDTIMLYTGEEIDGSYGEESDGGKIIRARADSQLNVTIPKAMFKNVKENMHIVVVAFGKVEPVAEIVSVPQGSEGMLSDDGQPILHHQYYTLEAAIEDAKKANENPGEVEIKILLDIEDEVNKIIEGNHVVIDLNGHTISLESEEKNNFIVDAGGNLTIIDKSEEQTGTVINGQGTAIYIKDGGECTLGVNEEGGIPSPSSPKIQGLTYGIEEDLNQEGEGTFNFYDGIIIGGTAAIRLDGVDEYPLFYSPTVTSNPETGNQESILQIVSGIEAMIGKKQYQYIEQAIEAANKNIGDSDTQVEITIVADITKSQPVVVDNTKNIKLDLNGHFFTSSVENYVIKNYGLLEIIDSTESIDEETGEIIYGTGKVSNSAYTTVYNGIDSSINGSRAKLTLSSGIISNSDFAVIENEADLYINGGKIVAVRTSQSSNPPGGIYNVSGGYLEVNSGVFEISGANNMGIKTETGSSATIQGGENISINNSGELYVSDVIVVGLTNSGDAIIEETDLNCSISNSSQMSIKNSSVGGIGNTTGGTLLIENVTINEYYEGIIGQITGISNSGTITVNGLDITLKDSNGKPSIDYGISNVDGGFVTINSAEIYARIGLYNTLKTNSSGNIFTDPATIIINGGKIEAETAVHNESIDIIQVNGGELISTGDSGIESYGDVEVTGGKIRGNVYGIYQNKGLVNGTYQHGGNTTVTGGEIQGNVYGIYQYEGNTIVKGGTISAINATSYGIVNSTGNLTIGTNDGTANTENLLIKGQTNAINNLGGKLYYYDGVLAGAENNVIKGSITEFAEGYSVVKQIKEDGLQHVHLGIPTEYVARIKVSDNPNINNIDAQYYKIEDEYYYIADLKIAVEMCSKNNSSTIELLVDNIWVVDTITVDEAQDITIQFNDNVVYLLSELNFNNNGKVTFENGTGDIVQNLVLDAGIIIQNNENATVNLQNLGINFVGGTTYTSEDYKGLIVNNGKLNIANCEYTSDSSIDSIYNGITGSLNIEYSQIKTGDIHNESEVIKDSNNNEISSVVIEECEMSYITNIGSGTIEMNNCTVDEVSIESGKLIIDGEKTIIDYITNNSNLIIKNGKILSIGNIGNAEFRCGTIENVNNKGEFKITGEDAVIEDFINDGTTDRIVNSGKMLITAGKVKVYIENTGEMIITAGEVEGAIRNTANTSILTIGQQDGIVKYTPIISGGVTNNANGVFNFYDGIIEGTAGNSIVGLITETEKEMTPVTYLGEYVYADGTETGYIVSANREIKVLEKIDIVYLESTGKNYTSFKAAIEDSQEIDTIKIIKDAEKIAETDSVTIPEGKTITLDINGKTLYTAVESAFINNGTLKIVDSTEYEDSNGEIVAGVLGTNANILIENNNILYIESGILELAVGGTASEFTKLIINKGTIEATGGRLQDDVSSNELIHNVSGTAIINGMEFQSNKASSSRAILAEGGTINMESVVADARIYVEENAIVSVNSGEIVGVTNYGKFDTSDTTLSEIVNYGTFNMINSNSKGITNYGEFKIINGSIEGVISNEGTLNIESQNDITPMKLTYTSTSKKYALTNSGEVTIKGYVEVNSETGGIANNSGLLTIGDDTNVTNTVKIIASDIAVSNNGEFNYYGGILQGSNAVSVYINKIPDGYKIQRTLDDTIETYSIEAIDIIASVEEKEYNSLEKAFDETDNGTIKLLKDIVMIKGQEIEIAESKNIVLDLNGHTLEILSDEVFFINNGKLEITDSSDNKTGTIVLINNLILQYDNLILNNGELTISGGQFQSERNPISNSGKLIISSGKFQSRILNSGELVISEGEFQSDGDIIDNIDNGIIQIDGGVFKSYGYSIDTSSTGKVEINGGEFSSLYSQNQYSECKLLYAENSTVKINGGTFIAKQNGSRYRAEAIRIGNNASLSISGSARIETSAILHISNSDLNISGGTLYNCTIKEESLFGNGSNKSGFTINITGGDIGGISAIDATESTLNIYEGASINIDIDEYRTDYFTHIIDKVYIYGATIQGAFYQVQSGFYMDGGSITSQSDAITSGGTIEIKSGSVTSEKRAIYTNVRVSIIIGEDTNGYPNQTNPSITGGTYGIYTNTSKKSTIKFYDGIITGGTKAINEEITNTPKFFETKFSNEEKVATLGLIGDFTGVAEVNGVLYDTLQEAINAAISVNGIVKLCYDTPIENSIQIAENAEITIDLAGNSIYGYISTGATIVNNGTLIIKDSTSDGTDTSIYGQINNYLGVAIENNGTLIIGENDGNVNTISPRIIGLNTAINNNGNLSLFDGQIGTLEMGTIVSGTSDITVPDGYKTKVVENNYVLAEE